MEAIPYNLMDLFIVVIELSIHEIIKLKFREMTLFVSKEMSGMASLTANSPPYIKDTGRHNRTHSPPLFFVKLIVSSPGISELNDFKNMCLVAWYALSLSR